MHWTKGYKITSRFCLLKTILVFRKEFVSFKKDKYLLSDDALHCSRDQGRDCNWTTVGGVRCVPVIRNEEELG